MQVKILFFGITTDITKEKSTYLTTNEDITINEIRKKIIEIYPKLNEYKSFSVAVNMEYATDKTIVKNGDIIALIPPVSGG